MSIPEDELHKIVERASDFAGGDRDVNMEAIALHEAAITLMERPQMCPFCSMLWDQAEAERLMNAGDSAGYAEWIRETMALPVNAEGDDFGDRPRSE